MGKREGNKDSQTLLEVRPVDLGCRPDGLRCGEALLEGLARAVSIYEGKKRVNEVERIECG